MTLQEIKQQYRMIDILNKYAIKVNRGGFICCPFHNEKTPSMKIYDRTFHCFGCGVHGDVLDFEQKYNNIDFQTAFKMLGGSTEELSFSQKLSIYKSKKNTERKEIVKKKQQEAEAEEVKSIKKYKCILKNAEKLSDEWAKSYNKLLYLYNNFATRNGWDDWGEEDLNRWLNWTD